MYNLQELMLIYGCMWFNAPSVMQSKQNIWIVYMYIVYYDYVYANIASPLCYAVMYFR